MKGIQATARDRCSQKVWESEHWTKMVHGSRNLGEKMEQGMFGNENH